MFKKLLFLLFVLSFSVLVLALDDQENPNDPNINERANACYEDGSMAGKCDTAWEWEAGWYLIRFQAGLISREDFPAQFVILLPPLPEEAAATDEPYVYPTAGCVYTHDDGGLHWADFNGGNFLPSTVTFYGDSGCTIVTGAAGVNLAYAVNSTDALAICQSHGFTNISTNIGPVLGANVYRCY